MPNLGGWEFVILIGILVLLFGAKRLPDMARSIGQSARVFKGEMKGMKNDEPAKPADPAPTQAPPAELPPAKAEQPAPAPGPAVNETVNSTAQEPTRAAGQGPGTTGK